jgi:hypothetical protein
MSADAHQTAERIVTAIEGRFRDWLMSGEHAEAVALVEEILDERPSLPVEPKREPSWRDL